MSQQVADSVRSLPTIAVNQAFELAPWATALCANDAAWWRANAAALKFAGRRFSSSRISGVERVTTNALISTSSNTGVLALEVAVQQFGMTEGLLLGCDFAGSHFFGEYKDGLKNTTQVRRGQHAIQFSRWAKARKGVKVYNGTAGSALTVFPYRSLEEFLA